MAATAREADGFEQIAGRDRVGVVVGEEIEHALGSEHRVHARRPAA